MALCELHLCLFSYLYRKLIDLHSKSVKFEQELYKPSFPYEEAKPFFHCFESDSNLVGLSFADATEAHNFFVAIKEYANGATPGGPHKAPPPPPSGTKPAPPAVCGCSNLILTCYLLGKP